MITRQLHVVLHFSSQRKAEFNKKWHCPTGLLWRMNETPITVKGDWKYRYCSVVKAGKTIDFLLTAKRALRFFKKVMGTGDVPIKVSIDKSRSHALLLNKRHHPVKEKIHQANDLNEAQIQEAVA